MPYAPVVLYRHGRARKTTSALNETALRAAGWKNHQRFDTEVDPEPVAVVPEQPTAAAVDAKQSAATAATDSELASAIVAERASERLRQDAAYVASGQQTAADVGANETTTSTTYAALATAGPAVTVTPGPSGRVRVVVECEAKSSAADVFAGMTFAATGGNAVAADDDNAALHRGTNFSAVSRETTLTGLAQAATTFTAQYRSGGSATASFARRRITVTPI